MEPQGPAKLKESSVKLEPWGLFSSDTPIVECRRGYKSHHNKYSPIFLTMTAWECLPRGYQS